MLVQKVTYVCGRSLVAIITVLCIDNIWFSIYYQICPTNRTVHQAIPHVLMKVTLNTQCTGQAKSYKVESSTSRGNRT